MANLANASRSVRFPPGLAKSKPVFKPFLDGHLWIHQYIAGILALWNVTYVEWLERRIWSVLYIPLHQWNAYFYSHGENLYSDLWFPKSSAWSDILSKKIVRVDENKNLLNNQHHTDLYHNNNNVFFNVLLFNYEIGDWLHVKIILDV